jgi:hypothetical protein
MEGMGLLTRPFHAHGFKNDILSNYYFDFALGVDGFLGEVAAAAGCFTSSNSISKTSVAPPGIIGGLP